MIYAVLALLALIAIGSLAVDLGRVQAVKSDLQKAADATARGALSLYKEFGSSVATSYSPYLGTSTYNLVESGTGVQPKVTITWGQWDEATGTFTAGSYNPPAVKVTVVRNKTNNNPVPLTLGAIIGFKSCDVTATAIARLTTGATTTNYNVSSQSDIWLSGMPSGSTASYNDTAPSQSPVAINLPANASGYITFTNVTGTVQNSPTATAAPDPDGKTSSIYSHGADSPGGPTPAAENGIADISAPISGLIGLFLSNSAPNLTAAPTARDYSTSASRDNNIYSDIELKQPFFIGDGQTSSGTVQQFRIPPGATRLYLGPMDGHEWANNLGSFTVTLTHQQQIEMVR